MDLTDIDTSGFYSGDYKLRAGKFVYGPDFTLLIQDKDTYTYPIHGWYYFDNAQQASEFFNIPIEEFNLDLTLPTE